MAEVPPSNKKTNVREPIGVPKSLYINNIDIAKVVDGLPQGIVGISAWTSRSTS